MSEQRVTTLVVEVAGRKSNIETILQALQRDLRGAAATAKGAETAIGGGLAAGSTKAAKELLQLAQASQKVATEEQKAAAAAAKAAAEQAKVAAQQSRAAVEGSKLAAAQQKVAAEEQKAALAGQRVATEAQRTAAAQARAEQAALRLAQAQNRVAQSNTTWAQGIRATAGNVDQFIGTLTGLGGAFAVVGAAQGLYSFAQQGAAIDAARKSFDNLASSAGTSGAALLRSLQQSAAGTVSNANIIKSSNTALLLLGADVASQLPQLLAVAKASATALGTDVGQVFDSLVTGISRGSTELIDNAGITIKAGEAYAAYAASIGKSADSLSASEKQQALLNGVLASGQQIIAQTSGGGEAAAATYQRMEASLANLTATAQTAAAQGLAPLAASVANVSNWVNEGISSLLAYGNQLDALNQRLVAAGGGYEDYIARVEAVNQQIRDSYGIFGIFAGTISALTPEAFALRDALIASGVGVAEADARAQAYNATLQAIAETQNRASITVGGVSEGFQQVATAAGDLIATNAELEPEIRAIIDAVNAQSITTQEGAAKLDELASRTSFTASAQADLLAETGLAADATGQLADEASAAAAMLDFSANAAQGQEAALRAATQAAYEAEAAGGDLEDQAHAAAQALLDAGPAGEEMASKLAGSSSKLDVLTAAFWRLENAKRAALGGGGAVGNLGGTDGLVQGAGEATAAIRALNRVYGAGPLAPRSTGSGGRGAGGGGGGGGVSATEKAATREAEQLRKLQEQRLQDQERINQQLEELDRDHYDKLLDIQADYERKTLAQQQQNQASARRSKFSFYNELTQAEIPQDVAAGLSAEYEAAFQQAQELSQQGKAKLGADYLALKQEQLQAELQFQQDLAKAREEKDKAEITRLEALAKLRRDAEQAELNNLLAGGDANVAQRDQALASEDERYTEAQTKIGDAAEQAAERKIESTKKSTAAIVAETAELQRQADLLATVNQQRLAAGAPAAGAPAAATTTPAVTPTAAPATAAGGAPGGQGGPTPVLDAAAVAALGGLAEKLDALKRAIDGINARAPFVTG